MQRWIVMICAVIGIAGGIALARFYLSQHSLQNAVDSGMEFLNDAYSPYHFQDPYLEYVYPGEHLKCSAPNCNLTYRVLDGFFDVQFIADITGDKNSLAAMHTDATTAFTEVLPEWRSINFNNTVQSTGSEGMALDTACILAYVTKDRELTEHIASFLTEDNNWISDRYYSDDAWRNIADETWCIRAMIATQTSPQRIQVLVEKALKETDAFLPIANADNRIAVLFHMVYLLHETQNPLFQGRLAGYAEQLATTARVLLDSGNTIGLANMLDALSFIEYSDNTLLTTLSSKLLAAQEDNGSWMSTRATPEYPVFTTFRAVLALLRYQHLNQSQ